LLVAGALLGGWAQTLLFAGALLVEGIGVYLTSRHGNWRLHSVAHLTERHGLFSILAIGESVVAIGVGAAEQRLLEARGQARVDRAVEAYTYGHFPLVAGIVLAALGVEGVLAHAGDREPLGAFYALPLVGGVVLYLAGQLLFKRRMHNALSLPRLVTIGVLLVALPAAVLAPPLAGLAGLVVILAALIVVETTRYAQTRRSLRGT
jgi:low temperature requirement protein LtrA